MTSPPLFVFLGPAGSGKGTQAQKIGLHFKTVQISTGDLLRKAISNKTSLGLRAKEYMEQGDLVPDDLILELVILVLEDPSFIHFTLILDGFPRTLNQAIKLQEYLTKCSDRTLSSVFLFDIDLDQTIHRITGREICISCNQIYHIHSSIPKRNGRCDNCHGELMSRVDDTLEKIKHRHLVYLQETEPLVLFYNNQLVTIDASKDADTIFNDLTSYIAACDGVFHL